MTQHAQQQQVVVVTGASGGIGRATAPQFGARGAAVALLARGRGAASRAPPRRCEAPAAARSSIPVDVADADAVDDAAATVEERARADRRLGQRRVHLGVRAVPRDRARRSSRRVTEVTYLGYVYGTMAALRRMRAARPRDDRAGRLGAGLPRHPAAVRLLRRQARDPGLPRVAALRAAARAQQRARDHGADAGGQHPAVLLGAVAAARARRSRCRRSTSPRSPPGGACTPPTTRGAASTGSAAAPLGTLVANAVAPGLLDRYLARTGFSSQQTDQPQRPRPAGQPVGAGRRRDGRTSAPTGASTTGRTSRSAQLWASQHHGLLGAARRGSRRRHRGGGSRRTPLTTRGLLVDQVRREAAVRRTTCTGGAPDAVPPWRRPLPGTTAAPAGTRRS